MDTGTVVRTTLLMVLAGLLAVSSASAAVTARVDRPTVELNESFRFEIVVDTEIDLEPDLTVLDAHFYLGRVSSLTNTTIYNGQYQRSRTWSVTLMAKSTGAQEIPSIQVGSEQSKPVSIMVNEPAEIVPGEADVFVLSELDQPETYVQAQILYRIKIYAAAATRQASLREPVISGAEALIELVGEDRSYESILNGRAYNVIERVIAIYPQESGEIAISPARFEARVLRDGRITGRKVFESDAHTVKVLPIPSPPDDFPDAVWLPARAVELSEDWSKEPRRIQAGEPVTRHVTISALGQLESQIPALEPPVIDGMNVYADKPDLSRKIEAQGIRGIRKDQYAMIAVRGGVVAIPELAVPWWDIESGEWRVARLPARSIEVEAADIIADVVVDAGEDEEVSPQHALQPSAEDAVFWQQASQLLAAIWLLTVLAWWWSSRRSRQLQHAARAARQSAPPPIYKQQAKFVKAARKAAYAGDQAGARQALIEWGRLQWPEHTPRSISDIAGRVAAPLRDELQQLSAVSYGREACAWDGSALATALGSIHLSSKQQAVTSDDPLPPLLPPGA